MADRRQPLSDVRELLTGLVDKSLLHPVEHADPVEPRYRVRHKES